MEKLKYIYSIRKPIDESLLIISGYFYTVSVSKTLPIFESFLAPELVQRVINSTENLWAFVSMLYIINKIFCTLWKRHLSQQIDPELVEIYKNLCREIKDKFFKENRHNNIRVSLLRAYDRTIPTARLIMV